MKSHKHRTLWELTRGQRLRYGAAILSMGLANAFVFGLPFVSQAAIDGFLAPEPSPNWLLRMGGALWREPGTAALLALSAGLIVFSTALGGVFQYVKGRLSSTASEALVRGLRDRLLAHLEALPSAYHDKANTGDLVQRCTSDVETVRVFLSVQIVEIGRIVLLILVVLPLMLWMDERMTWIALALFPLILGLALVFFRRLQRLFQAADEAEAALSTVLQENLTGIRVVRAFARQSFEIEKFAAKNAVFRDLNTRLIRLMGKYWGLSDFLCLSQIGLVLVAGATFAAAGELSTGTLFAFWTIEWILVFPVRHLGRVLMDTGKALVALGRLREILEVDEESKPASAGANPPVPLAGELEFDGVTFGFGEGEPVLSDLSFHVAPGETLALLGPPGSGKSTVIQLLLRLYDVEAGAIRLDGRDLCDLGRDFVRTSIACVLQEPFLYSRSVRANLAVGLPHAGETALVRAASEACIHASIESFEHGYDTLVGERGVTLSGGQRQRVALARALLKDAPILVLDDALSAIDTHTESAILEALRRRAGVRTTLIVSHRLSSVVHADRILVLERGRVAQSGSHRELVGRDGPYRRLWRIQGALEDEIGRDVALSATGGDAT